MNVLALYFFNGYKKNKGRRKKICYCNVLYCIVLYVIGSVERWWISINHWKSESVGKWFVTANYMQNNI